MAKRHLRRILFPTWPDMQALADEWKAFIERLDSWSWGPGFDVDDGDGGRTVSLKLPPSAIPAVVATEITASSGDTLGQGTVTLKPRDGATVSTGQTVRCWSYMTSAVTVGTRVHVHPDGADYMLGIVNCP